MTGKAFHWGALRREARVGIVLGGVVLGTALLLSLRHDPVAAPDGTMLAEGRTLYLEHCAGCHGVNLEGQPNWRERKADGRLPAPPHDETGHTWEHSAEDLFRVTKLGVEAIVGGSYRSDMRGFGDVLTDTEIRTVIAFIESTWPARIRKRREIAREKRNAQ